MQRPHPIFFALQQHVSDLAFVERNHQLLGSERHENDIEHSFTVAMLCWYICSHYRLRLDLEKIFKYALVHDFAERYAGDVNTFASTADRQKKVECERAALERLSQEFAGFEDLVHAMQAYEERADEESLFVWTVDKMQSMILADLDNWRPYRRINISYDRFVAKHSEHLAGGSPHLKEIFASLLEYCKTTYYDRPVDAPATGAQKHSL